LAETLDDIVFSYEEDGELLTEELDRIVIQKGVWAVVLFRYRDRRGAGAEFGPPKACLRRFQKTRGSYKKRDSINLSQASAQLLVSTLQGWLGEGLLGGDPPPEA
jgi:hypothetical protein